MHRWLSWRSARQPLNCLKVRGQWIQLCLLPLNRWRMFAFAATIFRIQNSIVGKVLGRSIDFDYALPIADGDREFNAPVWGSAEILCKACAILQKNIVFIGYFGCPTWIRTMTKASKGLCATITPSDRRGEKLTSLPYQAHSTRTSLETAHTISTGHFGSASRNA